MKHTLLAPNVRAAIIKMIAKEILRISSYNNTKNVAVTFKECVECKGTTIVKYEHVHNVCLYNDEIRLFCYKSNIEPIESIETTIEIMIQMGLLKKMESLKGYYTIEPELFYVI